MKGSCSPTRQTAHCLFVCLLVENSDHCDFTKLRNMLIRTHMQDLKDVTQDVHYENFRLHRLRKQDMWDIRTFSITF